MPDGRVIPFLCMCVDTVCVTCTGGCCALVISRITVRHRKYPLKDTPDACTHVLQCDSNSVFRKHRVACFSLSLSSRAHNGKQLTTEKESSYPERAPYALVADAASSVMKSTSAATSRAAVPLSMSHADSRNFWMATPASSFSNAARSWAKLERRFQLLAGFVKVTETRTVSKLYYTSKTTTPGSGRALTVLKTAHCFSLCFQ